jgi:hypothetical protein
MQVRGDLGPVRRIAPALRQNTIRSRANHQLGLAVTRKNLSLQGADVPLVFAVIAGHLGDAGRCQVARK